MEKVTRVAILLLYVLLGIICFFLIKLYYKKDTGIEKYELKIQALEAKNDSIDSERAKLKIVIDSMEKQLVVYDQNEIRYKQDSVVIHHKYDKIRTGLNKYSTNEHIEFSSSWLPKE